MSRRPRQRERGQISIMIAIMMMTFLVFFGFVINTGMLVTAKINLQNAADMAAYAGAAQQARQLTYISYLNYEMRRQYKKFLFRYYVLGNMSKQSFPRSSGETGKMVYSPDKNAANDYGVPVVCVIRNAKDNFCQIQQLPKIQIPKKTGLDQINSTLIEVLSKIENARQKMCQGISSANLQLLRMWLYNTDPNYENLQKSGNLSDQGKEVLRLLNQMAQGLGLVPRELMLASRITNIEKTQFNPDPETVKGITYDKVQSLKGGADAAKNERTILAFTSAYSTLGEGIFQESGSITMDELEGSSKLTLNPIKIKFDTYAQDMDPNGDGNTTDATQGKDCKPVLIVETLGQEMAIGFSKSADLTFYAVRLRADNPKLLFWPFGDVTLKAYAAARPFGSRIGPALDEKGFLASGTVNGKTSDGGLGTSRVNKYPNLPVKVGDKADKGKGWDTKEVVYSMYGGFAPTQDGEIPETIKAEDIDRATQRAMGPNPYEASMYNIINDLGKDPFQLNFGTDHMASIWAPAPKDFGAALEKLFGQGASSSADGQADEAKLKSEFQRLMDYYITQMQSGKGEDNEGLNVARLGDPFVVNSGRANAGTPLNVSGAAKDFFLDPSKPETFRTSFAGVLNNDSVPTRGRVGYSVKFVSFDSLIQKKSAAIGGGGSEAGTATTMTNGLVLDTDASDDDITGLKH